MEETDVWKMRRLFPKEFHCLVKMHLSFLLDLNTDDCDCSFIYDNVPQSPTKSKGSDVAKMFFVTPRKTSNAGSAAFKGVMEGLPLTMEGVCQIYQLIHFLQRTPDHLRVEGLFRKHGNLKKQQALRERLNRGVPIDLDDGEFTVHEVASVLKTFMSELPEPLLTDACYRAHCQVAQMPDKKKQIHALQLLFLLIPDSHYQLLKDTLLLLHATADQEKFNKMSASNLATVFATHLLCPRKLSAEILQSNHQLYIKSVTLMIEEAIHLFSRAPPNLSEDVVAHFRRQEEESKLLDRPPQFSSVHRVQTRRQGLNRSQALDPTDSPSRHQSPVVNTIFTFVDRKTTSAVTDKSTTATELAKLYAHVQAMPESAQKKKLVQKLNDANGIGTPSRRIKTKTQKTKNQLKNFLTPRATRTSKLAATPIDEKKSGWHASNSYNIAQVVTSEQKPPSSAMSSFKRRASEERQIQLNKAKENNMVDNVETASTTPSIIVENVSDNSVDEEHPSTSVDICPRKTLGFDVVDDDVDEPEAESEEEKPELPEDVNSIQNKKLPPPPIPPRISSLLTSSSAAPSPLSQKIAASRNVDPDVLATPRNRKPLVLISSNSQLPPPEPESETKDKQVKPGLSSVRWDSGYLSQKSMELPPPPSPTEVITTSEVVDVDEELERMEKEEFDKSIRSTAGNLADNEDERWPTPPKMIRLSSSTLTSYVEDKNVSVTSLVTNESVTSSVIQEEAERLLRGDLDPSDSMCAFLDGEAGVHEDEEQISSPDDKTTLKTPVVCKMGRKRRSITELGGPIGMGKASTPTGIYFETDL